MAWFRRMGADSVEYHRRTVLRRSDDHPGQALDYYGSSGETPLVWGGRLAGRLGLTGAVDDASYEAVFGPGGVCDPHLGERLVRTRRPGMELVVAAHKSVAVLGLLGRVEDMHSILDAETDATLGYLEEWFVRQGGRRGQAQQRTATGGLLWARTRHATSRAGDPAPHDHVLVANLTEMLDDIGGWKALDTAGLRDLVHAATMVGRLAAAGRAIELGYAIEPDPGPSGKLDHWAIAGIPQDVVDLFSKRSAEIDLAMEAEGLASYQARGIAARATRGSKQDESPEALMVRWHDELERIGWPARRLYQRLQHVQDRRHRSLKSLTEPALAELAGELVGPGGALANRKAFTRADVTRVAAPRLYGHEAGDLDRVVTAVLRHPEAIPLVGLPGARSRAWAAASALATEAAIADIAERMADRATAPAVPSIAIERTLATKQAQLGGPLTAGQIAAARAVASSGRGLDLIVGVAGSGKTSVLETVRAAFEAGGHNVLGAATSGQAARTLAEAAGIRSHTVASLRLRLASGDIGLDAHTVLVLDEAGMTDDHDLLAVLAAADAHGAKVIATGDHHQLGAVGPGGGLEALAARHHPAVHVLDENVRQHDAAERAALEQLRAGDTNTAVAWYIDHDRVRIAPTRHNALDAAVDGWFADQHRTDTPALLLAWRRANVAALNQRARARWATGGRLHGPEIEAGGRRYAAGDRIVALAPAHAAKVVTSERGTVTAVDDHGLSARMDNGRHVRLEGPALAADRLDHAYAMTVNRTQGATSDTAHVFCDGGGRELAYVAASRARRSTHVYVVADDLHQAAEDLRREWASERRKRWVLDTDSPAAPGTPRLPQLAAADAHHSLRVARLRAERAALATAVPDITGRLDDARRHAAGLRRQLEDLHAGRGRYTDTPPGRTARRLQMAEASYDEAHRFGTAPGFGRRARRTHEREVEARATELANARCDWAAVAGPTEHRLHRELADANRSVHRLETQHTIQRLDRTGDGIHARIAAIDRDLAMLDPRSSEPLGVAARADTNGPGLSV